MVAERRAASELQARLRSGEFVITAEITPPVSTDPAEFLRRAMPVYDLDSRALLALAHRMRTENALPTGTRVDGPMRLVLGAADVPVDPPPGWEPKSLRAKIDAGADFVQTQFCMDSAVVRRYM